MTSVIHLGAPPPPPPPLPSAQPTTTNDTTTEEESESEIEEMEPPFVAGCDRDIDRAGYVRYRSWARRHPDEAQDQHPPPPPRMYRSELTPEGKIRIIPLEDDNERRGAITPPHGLTNEDMSPIEKMENLNDSF